MIAKSKPVESAPTKAESSQVPPVKRYYLDREVEATGESDELSAEQKSQLKRLLGKVDKMKQGHVEGGGEVISGPSEVGEAKENNNGEVEDDDDGDHRPPIMKRAKLGPLPSFIPI